jgi:hypothetical protein
MQSPLSMQDAAHRRDTSGASPPRNKSITPDMTATGDASLRPAGATLGQASTHLPHLVQASSMSLVRAFSAASNPGSVMFRAPCEAISFCCATLRS